MSPTSHNLTPLFSNAPCLQQNDSPRSTRFKKYAPKSGTPVSSRHAPPHVTREEQVEYDKLKNQWSERLLALLHEHFPKTKGRVEFCDLSTTVTLEYYLRAFGGAGVGLDVSPRRFVDPDVLVELDARHPRVSGLWRAGQDHLLCGQVMASLSGIVTALRMRGPMDTIRFGVRAARLLGQAEEPAKKKV